MLEGYVVDGICRSFLFSDMLHTSKVTGLRVSADDRPEVVLDVFLDDDADGGLEVPSRVGGSRGGKNQESWCAFTVGDGDATKKVQKERR